VKLLGDGIAIVSYCMYLRFVGWVDGAAAASAWLVFFDESALPLIPPMRRSWSPRGQTLGLRHRFGWKKASMAAAMARVEAALALSVVVRGEIPTPFPVLAGEDPARTGLGARGRATQA
jgi:hypothetical protein